MLIFISSHYFLFTFFYINVDILFNIFFFLFSPIFIIQVQLFVDRLTTNQIDFMY